MSKYIDADEIIKLLADAPQNIMPQFLWETAVRAIVDKCDNIDIVRCKECKYAELYPVSYGGYVDVNCINGVIGGYGALLKPDDFCSYGERKESE